MVADSHGKSEWKIQNPDRNAEEPGTVLETLGRELRNVYGRYMHLVRLDYLTTPD